MWRLLALLLLPGAAAAQPADCPSAPSGGNDLPLSIELFGRPGVPAGTRGQAYVAVPMQTPGMACVDAPPPPKSILGGQPDGALSGPPSPDLLRGPGTPHVTIEMQ